jgi:hypothetical protein
MTDEQNKKRQRCEIWTRCMGYFRPVGNFNKGKKSEHVSRKHFTEVAVSNYSFNEKYELCNKSS